MKKEKPKAFTLVEILITVVIILIFAAVIIPHLHSPDDHNIPDQAVTEGSAAGVNEALFIHELPGLTTKCVFEKTKTSHKFFGFNMIYHNEIHILYEPNDVNNVTVKRTSIETYPWGAQFWIKVNARIRIFRWDKFTPNGNDNVAGYVLLDSENDRIRIKIMTGILEGTLSDPVKKIDQNLAINYDNEGKPIISALNLGSSFIHDEDTRNYHVSSKAGNNYMSILLWANGMLPEGQQLTKSQKEIIEGFRLVSSEE